PSAKWLAMLRRSLPGRARRRREPSRLRQALAPVRRSDVPRAVPRGARDRAIHRTAPGALPAATLPRVHGEASRLSRPRPAPAAAARTRAPAAPRRARALARQAPAARDREGPASLLGGSRAPGCAHAPPALRRDA